MEPKERTGNLRLLLLPLSHAYIHAALKKRPAHTLLHEEDMMTEVGTTGFR